MRRRNRRYSETNARQLQRSLDITAHDRPVNPDARIHPRRHYAHLCAVVGPDRRLREAQDPTHWSASYKAVANRILQRRKGEQEYASQVIHQRKMSTPSVSSVGANRRRHSRQWERVMYPNTVQAGRGLHTPAVQRRLGVRRRDVPRSEPLPRLRRHPRLHERLGDMQPRVAD
jgi:hypothetical protein